MVNPTTLPPPKRGLVEFEYLMEVTTIPSISSEKDSYFTKANLQELGSSSQQVDPIKIRLSARVSEPESEPRLSDLQILQQPNTDIQKALFGAPVIREDIDATIVQSSISRSDEKIKTQPYQTVKENLGSSSTPTEPSSPLLGLTPLAPKWDLPSATMVGEGGRQPTDNDSHDESGGIEVSQNPIAPPMTSLEGATVIYSTGTTQDNIGMMETPIELLIVTQSLSPSVNRAYSETPTEPVSEDTTIPISTPPLV